MNARRSLCAFAAALLVTAGAASAEAIDVEIRARPITRFDIGSDAMRFGPLQFVGGLELTGSSRHFGALSAFRFLEAGGRFIGVADTGFWFFGTVERDEEMRPTGFSAFSMEEMVDAQGRTRREKSATDAEGLAVRDGVATAGFEREHRVADFAVQPGSMRPAQATHDFLVPRRELRSNRGFEAIAYAPRDSALRGALVVVSEKSLDATGNIFAAVLGGPEKGVFTVARRGEFDVTDGAFLPDGDLLLLERRFSMATGVGMRLRRISADTIGAGKLADGEVLLEADMGYQIDNMEALDVWRRPDGALMVSLMSDDNHSILQRNLYLEFRLLEE